MVPFANSRRRCCARAATGKRPCRDTSRSVAIRRRGTVVFGRIAAVIALGVVLACQGTERPPTATSASADSADQIVFGLNHQLTNDGVLRTRVQADTAYFYQISQKVAMRHIKVTFYSAT